MCGIVGYIGKRDAAPVLINGLSKLEYRGYDSAGIAVISNGETSVIKTKGRLADLAITRLWSTLIISPTLIIGRYSYSFSLIVREA